MTTHDHWIDAARKAGFAYVTKFPDDFKLKLEALYAIAHEDGRQAEREKCIELLRFNAGSCSEDSITRLILDANIEAIRARSTK